MSGDLLQAPPVESREQAGRQPGPGGINDGVFMGPQPDLEVGNGIYETLRYKCNMRFPVLVERNDAAL
jgi:hypothetical protein